MRFFFGKLYFGKLYFGKLYFGKLSILVEPDMEDIGIWLKSLKAMDFKKMWLV